jgi:hypothetical protein
MTDKSKTGKSGSDDMSSATSGSNASGEFFAVSDEMRKFTEASVEQARSAFHDFLSATTQAVGDAQSKGQNFQEDARQLSLGSVEYAQKSLESSFMFASKLAQARDMNDILELQKSYLEDQFKAAQSEMQRVSDAAQRMASELTPKS